MIPGFGLEIAAAAFAGIVGDFTQLKHFTVYKRFFGRQQDAACVTASKIQGVNCSRNCVEIQ
jgi:hypothetical protein